ncbi:hypothetical protein CU098_008287 [Rhizopus stolonifer]|uniref:3-oxo-5-alpha-steroid 4-dehydrogenase C-terminal domain-containing protein n=1 Tax=Rhizopus stolonifer TaxID=4846 RepID=A0A367IVW1_RHIST|nr:hypothetical protein CU098_008287 [Rhizopus stolonifer]
MNLQHYDIPIASQHVSRQQCVLGLMLMTIHLSRRVYESFWIEKPSKTATMHVSHYLAGIGFYGAMVLGTWLEGASSAFDLWQIHPDHVKSHTIPAITAILLFTYASYHQYHCHVILASLRKHTDTTYTIPRGDWFEYIVTPHYFADILIYLSLCILYGFQNYIILCGFVWTIVNLSIVASETNTWYHTHFGSKYNQTFPDGRWKIIPGCY